MSLNDPEGIAAQVLRWRWFLPLAVVLMLTGLWVATWRYWDNRFTLDAKSDYVWFLAGEPRVHPIGLTLPAGAEIILSRFRVDDVPPELAGITSAMEQVHLRADRIIIRRLAVTPGSRVAFVRARDGAVEIHLLGASALHISLQGRIERMADGAPEALGPPAEVPVPLTLQPLADHDPLRLLIRAPAALDGLEILDQRITALGFTPPQRLHDAAQTARPLYRSELQAGSKLKLLDTGQELTLAARELIWFADLSATTLNRLTMSGAHIAVDAFGRARAVSLGPQDTEASAARGDRDVTPSVLAYLLGRHDLKLLWLAGGAVLGALWKARQWAKALKT